MEGNIETAHISHLHLNPNRCTNVTVDGPTISSTGPNTDGRDPESCAGVVAGHRIKTNTLRGGYVLNTNVYRVSAGTIGGPPLKIEGNYRLWPVVGASASDRVTA